MIRLFALIFYLWCLLSCKGQPSPRIVTGADQITELVGKLNHQRVALVVNHTALVEKTHLIDTLKSLGVNIVRIFGPEHGFRGEAADGELVNDSIDIKTGLSIASLYGKNKKPTPQQLSDVDYVVFDIQDVGARFYTYISTLGNGQSQGFAKNCLRSRIHELSMDPAHGEGGLAARSTGVEQNSRSPVDRRGGAFGDGVNSASCSAREGNCRCEGYSNRSEADPVLRAWVETGPRSVFPDRAIGGLVPGQEASFLVLDADPSKDFARVEQIRTRVKQGVVLADRK